MARGGRRTYLPDPRELPELPELASLGHDTVRRAGAPPLTAHAHGTMELCFIERGAVTWWVEDELHVVRGGHVYVTWPDELHGGLYGVLHPCTLWWLGIPLWPGGRRGRKTFLDLPRDEASALVGALQSLLRRVFPVPPSIRRAWQELLDGVERPPEPLRTVRLRAALLSILLSAVEASRTPTGEQSTMVREALRHMEAALDRPIQIEELARRLGWSPSHVQHRFRAEVGVGPAEWHLRLRVAQACRRLQEGDEPVTRIGLELGFGSSQYFATAFRRVTGLSPTEFRDAARRGSARTEIRGRGRARSPSARGRAGGPPFRR